jgi:hypothetical protein
MSFVKWIGIDFLFAAIVLYRWQIPYSRELASFALSSNKGLPQRSSDDLEELLHRRFDPMTPFHKALPLTSEEIRKRRALSMVASLILGLSGALLIGMDQVS